MYESLGWYVWKAYWPIETPVFHLLAKFCPRKFVIRILWFFWLIPFCVCVRADDALAEWVVTVQIGQNMFKERYAFRKKSLEIVIEEAI